MRGSPSALPPLRGAALQPTGGTEQANGQHHHGRAGRCPRPSRGQCSGGGLWLPSAPAPPSGTGLGHLGKGQASIAVADSAPSTLARESFGSAAASEGHKGAAQEGPSPSSARYLQPAGRLLLGWASLQASSSSRLRSATEQAQAGCPSWSASRQQLCPQELAGGGGGRASQGPTACGVCSGADYPSLPIQMPPAPRSAHHRPPTHCLWGAGGRCLAGPPSAVAHLPACHQGAELVRAGGSPL